MKLLFFALFAATATAGPVQKLFNLQTTGASNSSHNDLYLSTQAIDPLNSDAIFRGRNAKDSTTGTFYLTNGTVRWEARNEAPYALTVDPSENVKGPVKVRVSPTTGGTGFSLAKDGALVTAQKNWGGWIVCDNAGKSSLYYTNTAAGSGTPAGCDHIDLKAKYVTS